MTKLRVAFRNFVRAPKNIYYQDFFVCQRKIIGSVKQNYRFFSQGTAWLTQFSQFYEYLAKHGKIQIHKIKKTNSRYKSDRRIHSTKLCLCFFFLHVGLFLTLGLQVKGIGLI